MRILFWTGYRFETFNGNSKSGLGGTENALIEVSKRLVTYGHEVHIAGEVESSNGEKIDGVTWYDLGEFAFKFLHRPSDYFDVVIGVNYLHFLNYLEEVDLNPKYKWFWMHNTTWEPWYEGRALTGLEEYNWMHSIQHVISPSPWATQAIIDRIIEPMSTQDGPAFGGNAGKNQWRGQLTYIPNGINPEDFFPINLEQKDLNKFIWSSAVDRGLVALLDNWYKIRSVMPNATLDVYYPKYSDPHNEEQETWFNIDGVADKLKALEQHGVTDMGSVSKEELYKAARNASYWMYLSDYEETFCITALEMQMSGVLCFVSDKAALPEVVKDGVIIPSSDYDTMFTQAANILANMDSTLKKKALKHARSSAEKYTWDIAAGAFHRCLEDAEMGVQLKEGIPPLPPKPPALQRGDWQELTPGLWKEGSTLWLRKPKEANKYILAGWRMVGAEVCKELIRENFPETANLNHWSKTHAKIEPAALDEFIDTDQTKVFLIISDPREVALNSRYFDNGLHIEQEDYDDIAEVAFLNSIVDKQVELIKSYKSQFGNNCIVLKSEDAIYNQDKFLGSVSKFLNLEPLGVDDSRKYKWSIHKNIGNFHSFFKESVLREHFTKCKSFYDEWGYDYGGYAWLKYHWHTQYNTLERNIKEDYNEMLKRNGVQPSDRTKNINEF